MSGFLSENGVMRIDDNFRSRSCYIMQDDQLQLLLTVQESMFIAANLKLPGNTTPIDKGNRVSVWFPGSYVLSCFLDNILVSGKRNTKSNRIVRK